MDILHPDNVVEVIRQMLAFFCWFFAARLGWRYADWLLSHKSFEVLSKLSFK